MEKGRQELVSFTFEENPGRGASIQFDEVEDNIFCTEELNVV